MLIVIGVSAALAADSWRESLSERKLEASHIDRLVSDLESQLLELEEAKREVAWEMAHGLAVLPYFSGELASDRPIAVIASAYQASRSNSTIELVDHTYVELLSTGGLRMISNTEIRAAIVDFYRDFSNNRPAELRDGHNEAYYNAARARIPVQFQQQIRNIMRSADSMGCALSDEPLQCDLIVDHDLATETVLSMTNPEMKYRLNLWMQSLFNELGQTDLFTRKVNSVLQIIAANRP